MNNSPTSTYHKPLAWLIIISVLVRAFMAWWLELGNDEVYYWTYALYPDWSHYDHPPMVGFFIQLFSLNLLFDSELFIRLSSVLLFSANTWLMYVAGKLLAGERAGFMAALLYNASIYALVITGIFILPDTPQNFFWMLSLVVLLKWIKTPSGKKNAQLLLLFGLLAGLGMLSKYTSIFLWGGLGLYVLLYDRKWLLKPVFYLAILFSALLVLPIIFWNIKHDWISFAFQGSRVNMFEGGLRPDLFFRELMGQVVYNNPINFVLIAIALYALAKGKYRTAESRLLLYLSLPLIVVFLLFALFRETLPHWTGPAYNTLLLLAALPLAEKATNKKAHYVPAAAKAALALTAGILLVGGIQINYGPIPMGGDNPYHRLGRHDITLDMYGWRVLKPAFEEVRNKHLAQGNMKPDDALVAENWFPLANLDYYVASPLQMKTLGLGRPDRIHKYLWINEKRGGFSLGNDYWYITDSRYYKHPESAYAGLFSEIVAADTITIARAGKPAKRFFVFMLRDLQQYPEVFFEKK